MPFSRKASFFTCYFIVFMAPLTSKSLREEPWKPRMPLVLASSHPSSLYWPKNLG